MSLPSTGSPYPPQLHLSIPPSTTSFKRSFEQFGFDLDDSPIPGNDGGSNQLDQGSGSSSGPGGSGLRPGPSVGAGTASAIGRDNNRNKRARSASSETNSSSGRSSRSNYQSVSSGSSSMHRLSARPSLEVPPRLPTPDVDVDMSDVSDAAQPFPVSASAPGATPPLMPSTSMNFPEAYSIAFQTIHGETSPTSPPVLPPLRLDVDHEEEPFTASPEQVPALNGDEPPRIHIDLPQAPLRIIEDEEEGPEAALALPNPPTLPPIPTGDLFEPAPQNLSDHLPPSPSLYELRQWIGETASPSAEARSDVADPGTSRVLLAAPSHSSTSPTNADGERLSPARNRLQRSLGDFLSVVVESDGDSPISSLFPERRDEASRRQTDSAEARRRMREGPSAVTSSYRPTTLSSIFTRRNSSFAEDDGDSSNPHDELLTSTAARDPPRPSTRAYNSSSANGPSSYRSTVPSAPRWPSLGQRSTRRTWLGDPTSLDFDSSSDDEAEPALPDPTRPYSGPFAFSSSTRRALMEERVFGRPTDHSSTPPSQPFSARPPRQVSFRPSSSSLIGETISDVRVRELNRHGLGFPTSSSTSSSTGTFASATQGTGSRSYPSTRANTSTFDLPRIQPSATSQSSILEDIADRMAFDRTATQAENRGPSATVQPPQPSAPSSFPTFYPTTLHDRRYPDFDLRTTPRSTGAPVRPSFPSFFDYDMAMAHDSESSGESSPVFEATPSRTQPSEIDTSRASFFPPAIPSPNLDLSFTANTEGSSAQSNDRSTYHRRNSSGSGFGQELTTTTASSLNSWPPFPDFPFAFDVFTNDLSHIHPSPSIEDPNPPLPSSHGSSSLPRSRLNSIPAPSATTSLGVAGSASSSSRRESLWESRGREVMESRYYHLSASTRERDEDERRRRTQEAYPYPRDDLRSSGPTFYPSFTSSPTNSSSVLPPSSSDPALASRTGHSAAATAGGRGDTSGGAIASRFIPGPFSNTMRALERERNAADTSRSFRQQHGHQDPVSAPARPRNPIGSPERTTTSAPRVQSHAPIPIPGAGSRGDSSATVNPAMTFHRQSRRSSFTGASDQQSAYTSTQRFTEDITPAVRRLREMQALHDRVLQVQLSSQTASTRLTGTGSTPSEPPRRTVHTQPLPQDVSAHPSPYSGTVTGTGRDSSTPSGPGGLSRLPASRTAPSSTIPATASTGRQAYTEDSSRPFAQAIESLREPRQGSGLSALGETVRRRARFEQLAEETGAMNRERARIIRAEYVNRRRHTLNLRGFSLGDFMRDEEFDESYEALLSLSSVVGDARPRGTSPTVLNTMEKGKYADWATAEGDKRCPICLDDYTPSDEVMKLKNCSHWLHEGCLDQWLKGANTCPVCRNQVNGAATKFGLDRMPTRESTTTNPANPTSSVSNTNNSTINTRARALSGYTPPRTGPSSPPSSRPTPGYYNYSLRRDPDDDDDSSGLGPSGHGTTSNSSSNSFGNFHRFL
ncbi:hypothetical protein FA13DRAFT_1776230 [Coprinellus micaceus]|uniref:RING-type domain-containing protein n=1 Tax=Coprinellus micaceus TaxID=71717 RepID=A0A4Y7T195_COPMI|nr:hypothetical protein FA13DRAFT_1776230 [Coprinellus micaceus]